MKTLMKTFLLSLILAYSLFAGTYDYKYGVVENTDEASVATKALDEFMYGDFKEIVRFNMLSFRGGELDVDSHENYDDIVRTIKDYVDKCEDVRVTIIGHTSEPTDDYNEHVADSDTYANAVQNLFRTALDTNTSAKLSESYAQDIQQKFIDSNISESITVVEYRRGDDLAFTDATRKGRNLSNRVMVTMYVNFPEEPVKPVKPVQPAKPVEIDSDGDGVFDSSDECPGTPKGIEVDDKGCPLDSDGDGVINNIDECPGTPKGFKVDNVGCPMSKELRLNFATNSYEIPQESHHKVVEFATFLKDNPAYGAEIVGHTDSIGTEEANNILSQNRAASVKTALVSEGIDASRLTTDGRGEMEPVQTNETKEGRKANRRTEVKLSYND